MKPENEQTDQTLATPIIALLKSSSELTPSVAYSMAYMMVRVDKRGEKKRLASCLSVQLRSFPSERDNRKENTRLVRPYLTRALCLRLGDCSAVSVHDRFLGASRGSIAIDVSDGCGGGERPP